ncbi:MAG: M23 family metallopeptidase [Moorea sp. SIO4G2]|uniref:Metalloendopeptidase n=1 Tax=Moorena bouillonii PNG TaxID=568701 RepID=A0A1U7N168_9CYAN|nr:M23 family metallopeptidase [Moorena bouillonii]NEO66848.1 M23 family metallopeptidase [Moorena sp. SIO4G2]OLT59697.1 metalloendopeptidase [Moorena bouillonii PNG]
MRSGYLSRLLIFAGLSLTSLIGLSTLSSLPSQPVTASEPPSSLVAGVRSFAKGGSFPVENFRGYTSGFGYRPSPRGSGWEFHRGLDIAAPEGSYIRNWWSGKVIKISDGTACGTSITIQSGKWQHIYCHMKGYAVKNGGTRYLIDNSGGIQIKEGQLLPSGARIGRVGMTGRTTGPHLHWGLKYGKQYVDPAQVLRAMYKTRA